MSYEYYAKISSLGKNEVMQKIVDVLSKKDVYVLLSENENKILLRFSELPERENWKEDISIEVKYPVVYLCFYNGNTSMIASTVTELDSILDCSFEEE